MIYELPASAYETVKPVFKDGDNVRVMSVIERNTKGKIWVDTIKNPSTVLVWSYYDMFTLGGCETNEGFNSALEGFVTEKIRPYAEAVGLDYFAVQLYPGGLWEDVIYDIFERPLAINYEYHFAFNYEDYTSLKVVIPQKGSLVYAGTLFTNELLKNEVKETWTFNKFAEKGLGVCLVHENEIVSSCLSRHVGGNQHNISINTYKKEDRCKGFATKTAKAFIDVCLSHQKVPVWKADESNTASQNLAEKLGFEKRDKYQDYYFLWEEP
jgi:hypothetical protein